MLYDIGATSIQIHRRAENSMGSWKHIPKDSYCYIVCIYNEIISTFATP